MWIYNGNKFAKFHGNTLSLSENIAKSFRGGYFFWALTVEALRRFREIAPVQCNVESAITGDLEWLLYSLLQAILGPIFRKIQTWSVRSEELFEITCELQYLLDSAR